jgi:hypothetical protein
MKERRWNGWRVGVPLTLTVLGLVLLARLEHGDPDRQQLRMQVERRLVRIENKLDLLLWPMPRGPIPSGWEQSRRPVLAQSNRSVESGMEAGSDR